MLPNILKLLTGGTGYSGMSGRIEKQLQAIDAYQLPVPPLDSVPIDQNKIIQGFPVADSIDYNLMRQ